MPVARPTDFIAALERIFQHHSPAVCSERIADALPLLRAAHKHHLQLLVVRQGGAVVGAMMVQALPGGMGIVWPPAVAPDCPDISEQEDALVVEAIAGLQERGARMAQALLPPEEAFLARALLRHGFTHPTRLLYLRREPVSPLDLVRIPIRLSFEEYSPANRDVFHQTLLGSYSGTLDFPELNDRRTLDDVLLGLQSSRTETSGWWLARDGTEPVAVLIVTAIDDSTEIVYMGVLPQARRKGFGLDLLRRAVTEAGTRALTVSVDSRNEPARRLYQQMNFVTCGEREVYLALW